MKTGGSCEFFTYHKQSRYVGFIWAMIGVMALESVGVSIFLSKWSPILHWIHLTLSILVAVFLIVDLKVVVKHSILLSHNHLSLKIGIRPKVVIALENIKELRNGSLYYEENRRKKDVLDLSLLGFDAPTLKSNCCKQLKSRHYSAKVT